MAFLTFLLGVGNIFFGGFVFMKLWNWFIATTLHAPVIGLAQAIGICLILLFFKEHDINYRKERDEEADLYRGFMMSVLYGFTLLIGLIVQGCL